MDKQVMDDELKRAIDRYVTEDMAARLVEANYRFLQERYPLLKAVAAAAQIARCFWEDGCLDKYDMSVLADALDELYKKEAK